MAGLLAYIKKFRSGGTAENGDDAPAPQPAPESEAQDEPVGWIPWLVRRSIPLMMLLAGLSLSVCTELIGIWALLGYCLLAASPIVYWLQQIEAHLSEIAGRMREGR